MHRSFEKLLKRFWWNPLGVLTWSGAGPCENILWRSCANLPQEVLALRSWRSSALVLLWEFFWDAHGKFSYEDLVRCLYVEGSFFDNLLKFSWMSCPGMRCWYKVLLSRHGLASCAKQAPAAAVPIVPNLICYCSIATVACIWYIDFLPPTLFGISCRCNLMGQSLPAFIVHTPRHHGSMGWNMMKPHLYLGPNNEGALY